MLTLKLILFTFCMLIQSKCKAKDYCSSEYCNNSKQHTLCKYRSHEPASHCIDYEKTISSQNERRAILDKINSRRNKVAAGEIRSLPPAESMMKLEWNKELEISAQRWADQCAKHSVPDIKDTCRDLDEMYAEQNIATIHGDAPGLTPLALVDVWYMELLNTNASIISRYASSSETGHSHYEYFTQLVWEDTTQVGCAGVKFKELLEDETVVKYRTISRLVCNFAPGGNRRNRTVYSNGVPCSKCPYDGVCDAGYKGLCTKKHVKRFTQREDNNVVMQPTGSIKSINEYTTQNIFPKALDTTLAKNTVEYGATETTTETDSDEDSSTTFDYFSHLYDFTRQIITLPTLKTNTCKDIMAVDNFVELLKKKLSNDPMIKELLLTTKLPGNNGNTDGHFNDDGVAAFVDRIYSKKEFTTTMKSVGSDYVNSTLLVDLIEAVMFRNSDKIPGPEEYHPNTQPLAAVKPIMIQAELAEVRQNQYFTGHYFFPEEEDDEVSSVTTESYYDNSNIPISDVVLEIEELKFSTMTNDFLDDILESDTATESTTTLNSLSPENINLYKSGHSVMKKFLQKIVDRSHRSKIDENPHNILFHRKLKEYKINEDGIKQNLNRKKREKILKEKEYTTGDYTIHSSILPKRLKKQLGYCCGTESNRFHIRYKQLLRKIAIDLKELRLIEGFRCTSSSSSINVNFIIVAVICYVFLK